MSDTAVSIPHVVRGELIDAVAVEHPAGDGWAFATPELDLDRLVWPRTEPLPAVEVPVAEIFELLAATGERLRADPGGHLAEALERLVQTGPYDRRILENSYADLYHQFEPDALWVKLANELGGPEVIDDWRRVEGGNGRGGWVRASPARLVHVLAGNSPGVAARSIAVAP